MATDDPDATAPAPSDRLLALYRRYLGEPEREVDVYLGFALFFGGIALGVAGLAVFLLSAAAPAGTARFWTLREVAIVLAFLGLPAFVLSVVVLLPVSRRAVYAAGAGAAICLGAVGLFVAVYPAHWNVRGAADYSAHGIAVYSGGLAVLVAATGSALVAHHLERATPAPGSIDAEAADAADAAEAGAAGEAVTDEQVERDIEAALSDADISWGGVEKTDTRRLEIDTGDDDIDHSGLSEASANTARSGSVDDAVSGLRKLQGRERSEATGESTDDQAAALAELRERKEAEPDDPESVVDRVRDRLGF